MAQVGRGWSMEHEMEKVRAKGLWWVFTVEVILKVLSQKRRKLWTDREGHNNKGVQCLPKKGIRFLPGSRRLAYRLRLVCVSGRSTLSECSQDSYKWVPFTYCRRENDQETSLFIRALIPCFINNNMRMSCPGCKWIHRATEKET